VLSAVRELSDALRSVHLSDIIKGYIVVINIVVTRVLYTSRVKFISSRNTRQSRFSGHNSFRLMRMRRRTNLHPDFARDAIRSQFIRLVVANRGRNVTQRASLTKASTNFLWIIFYMDTGERIEVKNTMQMYERVYCSPIYQYTIALFSTFEPNMLLYINTF
jgi:hypothetical protein